jgi:hypothetical protein
MIMPPTKPMATAIQRCTVTVSFRKRPAPSVTKKGEVITSAMAVPTGTACARPATQA